jgi:hypothetical protein
MATAKPRYPGSTASRRARDPTRAARRAFAGPALAPRELQDQAAAIVHGHAEFGWLTRLADRPRHHLAQDVAGFIAHDHFALGRLLRIQAPQPAEGHGEHRHGQHHGQPDAKVKGYAKARVPGHMVFSDVQSCCLAKT